jgi:hypothetical protein
MQRLVVGVHARGRRNISGFEPDLDAVVVRLARVEDLLQHLAELVDLDGVHPAVDARYLFSAMARLKASLSSRTRWWRMSC